MATKTKKNTKKSINKISKLNKSLVNASMSAINTTVENGEKWQKLTKKLIKKSEPVRTKQVNMVVDTAAAVKGQVVSGAERAMDLVGVDTAVIEKAKDLAVNHPVSKRVVDVAEDIKERVTDNPMVKKVEKTTEGIKQMGIAKFQDVKEDVLEQAQKILQRGEEIVEDAINPKKTAKNVKKGAAKAKKASKTVSKKAASVKKNAEAKVAVAKKATTKVVKEVKTETAKKVKEVAAVAKKSVKDDLKLIYGIGPKVEATFNKNGINTFAQLAKAEKAKIATILEEAGPLFKNMDTSDWKKQALVGAEGGAEAVKKWVARYRTA